MPEKKTLIEDLFYKGSSANLPRLHTSENKVPFLDKSKFFASHKPHGSLRLGCQHFKKNSAMADDRLYLNYLAKFEGSELKILKEISSLLDYQKHIFTHLVTLIEGNSKVSFSIATTWRCRGGRYSSPWIAPLYPWNVPYNAEAASSTIFWVFGMIRSRIEPRSTWPLANTLTTRPMSRYN